MLCIVLYQFHCSRIIWEDSLSFSFNVGTSGDVKYYTGDSAFYKRKYSERWKGLGTVIGQDGQQVLVKHRSIYVSLHPCRSVLEKMNKDVYEEIRSTINTKDHRIDLLPCCYIQLTLLRKVKIKTLVNMYRTHLFLNIYNSQISNILQHAKLIENLFQLQIEVIEMILQCLKL